MEHRKWQNTVLDATSEKVQPFTERSISRRQFVQTSAGVVAAGVLLGKRAFAAPRPLKIGLVSSETGVLSAFGETDTFVIDQVRKKFQGGIPSGGSTRSVEILVRDSQSSSNRAAQIAAELIKSDKIDLMLVGGAAEIVNPVSDQCEINQMPCVSSVAPWEPYFFGRGGNPSQGFDWTYHFFWGVEFMENITCDLFELLPTNKVVGLLLGNDVEGLASSDASRGCSPVFKSRGYKVVDPGRFHLDSNDYSMQISTYKKANVEILYGLVPAFTFSNFWAQAAQQGFKPKITTIGKATLFPSEVEALGPRGRNLSIGAWWAPVYPFKSNLTGQSAAELCDQYEAVTKKEWTQVLGFSLALFDVAADVIKRTQNLESAKSVIAAVRSTKVETIVGPIQWQGHPPNEWTDIPVKNVCTTPIVPAQWVPGKKWMYDFLVVNNKRYPSIPVQRKMEPMPE